MNDLMKKFALKTEHEDAVKRIEALEAKPCTIISGDGEVNNNDRFEKDVLDKLNKLQLQVKQHDLAL